MKPEHDIEQLRRGGVVKLKDKDMYSVWVRAVCDNMDARKLLVVADLADKYGKGYILFTTRQFPIIPHVHFDDVIKVKEELGKADIMLDRCGARVRNSDVCYDANICPYAVMDPISLGEKLDLFWRQDSGGFKIKTSIAGCKKQCTCPKVLADVGFVGVEEDGVKGYDVYLGGKLGLDPFVGIKITSLAAEDQCVKIVKNYVDFIKKYGREGERAAALIRRLGAAFVKSELSKDLQAAVKNEIFACETKQTAKSGTDNAVIRIRATNGEVTSAQARKIAGICEKYGFGFVHFSVRGAPEIPGIKKGAIGEIKKELKAEDLELLESGIDNLQSCFGGYCTNGNLNTQPFLRKVEGIVRKIGLNDLNIKISASGCPNSCGITQLSDIGYMGVVEPEVDIEKCTGCDICVKACKVKAIKIENKKAVIDLNKCKNCDICIKSCPFDALIEKREGVAVYVGGKGPGFFSDEKTGDTRLGEKLIDFISEERALIITEKILGLVKKKNKTVSELIEETGIAKFKEEVL